MSRGFTFLLVATAVVAAAPVSAKVNTDALKLVDASGVPNDAERRYTFQGAITFVSEPKSSGDFTAQYEKFWADGKGRWDQKTKEAKESFHFSGSVAGQLATTFKCAKDPWLTKAGGCVFVNAAFNGEGGKLYDWSAILKKLGRPLSGAAVDAALAIKLSAAHPPAGPKAEAPPPKVPSKLKEAAAPPTKLPANTGPVAAVNVPPLQANRLDSGKSDGLRLPVIAPGTLEGPRPDLTSAAQLKVAGKYMVAWGSAITLTDADARAAANGVCQVAFEHETHNAGPVPSGAFSRRWNNAALAAGLAATSPSIAPGATLRRVDTLALKPGVNQLVFGIDNLGQVKEFNENNNAYSLTVTLNGTCAAGKPVQAQGGGIGESRWGQTQGGIGESRPAKQQPR